MNKALTKADIVEAVYNDKALSFIRAEVKNIVENLLVLMKQAIKFENFKLPLEDLATYLAFAQQKAKDTG